MVKSQKKNIGMLFDSSSKKELEAPKKYDRLRADINSAGSYLDRQAKRLVMGTIALHKKRIKKNRGSNPFGNLDF